MFKYNSFKTIRKYFPINGLNLDINKRYIDDKYCSNINNIIPFPMGCGTVRNGSLLEVDAYAVNPQYIDAEIQGFYATKEQFVCYVADFVEDTITNPRFLFVDEKINGISFQSVNFRKYFNDSFIILSYSSAVTGDVVEKLRVSRVEYGENNLCILTLDGFFVPNLYSDNTKTIRGIKYPEGKIWRINRADKTINVLKNGLFPYCSPNFCLYKNHLFIANGVDDVLAYNWVDLISAYTWQLELLTDITRATETTITFVSATAVEENYDGKQIKTSNQILNCTDFAKDENNRVTLTFDSEVSNFPNNRNSISYKKILPKFSYLTVIADRLFALGEGLSGKDGREGDSRINIYHQFTADSLDLWSSSIKKKIPNIDLSIKHGVDDNIEAIASISGYILFIGRERTQVWSDGEPPNIDDPDFQYSMRHLTTLNIGILHKDLIATLPNMVIIATKNGLYSLSSFNQARQFAANPINGVNNYFKDLSKEAFSSNSKWLKTKSFFYSKGGFYGFRISTNQCIVGFSERPLDLFTKFSGDFSAASCFAASEESLFYAIKNKIFVYGDGYGSKVSYRDFGGKNEIEFSATFSPVKRSRYFNYFVDLDIDNPSGFKSLTIMINGENGKYFEKVLDEYKMDDSGDYLDSNPVGVEGVANDPSFFLSEGKYRMPQNFRFNSNEFFIKIVGSANSGKIIINKLELFGK